MMKRNLKFKPSSFTAFILAFCLTLGLLSGCKADSNEWQNQYLSPFGIDFIETECEKIENKKDSDNLTSCFKIKLNDNEKKSINSLIEKNTDIYAAKDKKESYNEFMQIVSKNFSDVCSKEDCYFALYNKISKKLVKADEFSTIDDAFFTALIYSNGELFIYDYNFS